MWPLLPLCLQCCPAGIAVLALTMATETARWIQAGILVKGWAAYSRVGVAAALGALALYQFKFAKK